MSDLHSKIVKKFVIRLILYTLGGIATVVGYTALAWAIHTYNISFTLVVPVAILIFSMTFAVWWLWHDTKKEVMDEHLGKKK